MERLSFFMAKSEVYLKLNKDSIVKKDKVYVSDLANVYCTDEGLAEEIKGIFVYDFATSKKQQVVISVLVLIEKIQKLQSGVTVNNIGETDALVERVEDPKGRSLGICLKVSAVVLITFFGAAFTIMAFHNDISINNLFEELCNVIPGLEEKNRIVLEVAYSVGLASGITIFFNHIGNHRITKDPTPIEVEMKVYESEINMAVIETANRKGESIEVK